MNPSDFKHLLIFFVVKSDIKLKFSNVFDGQFVQSVDDSLSRRLMTRQIKVSFLHCKSDVITKR